MMPQLTLLVTFIAAGCSVTMVNIDDGAYKAAWNAGWGAVIRDQAPWLPSGSAPGVCNAGGDKAACVDTDQRVSSDFQQLLQGLTKTKIPSEFSSATDTVAQGLKLAIQGLSDRDSGISGNDVTLFQRGQDELQRATDLINQGYEQFPAYDRPDPKPFGGK